MVLNSVKDLPIAFWTICYLIINQFIKTNVHSVFLQYLSNFSQQVHILKPLLTVTSIFHNKDPPVSIYYHIFKLLQVYDHLVDIHNGFFSFYMMVISLPLVSFHLSKEYISS